MTSVNWRESWGCLYKWRTKLEAAEPGEEASRPSTHAAAHRKEILQLKRLLAEKAVVRVAEMSKKHPPVILGKP